MAIRLTSIEIPKSIDILTLGSDNTWKYFTATFKMQDHLYVQYVEIYQFNQQFVETSNKFSENEKVIKSLSLAVCSMDEVHK